MSAPSVPASDSPSLNLLLIDEDPVFRLGLRRWLEQSPEFSVLADVGDGETALTVLRTGFVADRSALVAVDLVILDLSLGREDPDRLPGLELCQQLKAEYPSLPVLFLSSFSEPVMLAAAQQSGADGYCPKEIDVEELSRVIRQVAAGQPCWIRGERTIDRASVAPVSGISSPNVPPSPSPPPRPAPLALLRRNLRRSGIHQIESALAEVNAQLQSLDLSDLNRAIAAGRQRELRVARRLVNWLLATPSLADQDTVRPVRPRSPGEQRTQPRVQPQPSATPLPTPTPGAIVSSANSRGALVMDSRDFQSVLFDAIVAKLQGNLENGTDTTLEIDILRDNKKRELFYLTVRKLEELLSDLRLAQIEPAQLQPKRPLILQDLWQSTMIDFFGKYYTVVFEGVELEVVNVLLQDVETVQTALLNKIPGVTEVLKHLVFQEDLLVEGIPYPPGNPESLRRAEMLLENLLIQVANAVMQPLLNRFANVEAIKQNFYDYRLLSSREIERFRNDLSWRYRLEQYVKEPTNIFESKYPLFVFSGRGIRKTSVYAPRYEELENLSGIPLMVTLALETRDAVAPRLRSVVSFVGNGVIYVLTEVIGRGIGLIGRGVIKGIGNVWQDGRVNRR